MSDLTEAQIASLAQLCRLELTPEELPRLQNDLQRILSYVEKLQEIDLSSLAPYSHMEEQSLSAQREDEVKDILLRDHFLANAPEHIGGMVRVPTVISHASKDS